MSAAKRIYPRKAWVLTTSFNPKEVIITGPYEWHSSYDYGDMTDAGKLYPVEDLHPTMQDAIAQGWKDVKRIQADLDKRAVALGKKRATLNKAASK